QKGLDAHPFRVRRLVAQGDGQERVGLGVEEVIDTGGQRLHVQGRRDPQGGRVGGHEAVLRGGGGGGRGGRGWEGGGVCDGGGGGGGGDRYRWAAVACSRSA